MFEAFAFPWEAKFQKVASQIEAQIRRIQELASASHFHATLCNHSLLQSLWERQQEERASYRQAAGPDQFRMEIKEEMKKEIEGLLENFNTRWVQRFDELLLQKTALHERRDSSHLPDIIGSTAQLALPVFAPQIYLADFVSNPQTLFEFRNEVFPQLQRFDQREGHIRAGSRGLTSYEWQHCVALLRHPSMRSWMSSEQSAILWINTCQKHKLDWASVLLTRLKDECARLEFSMTLAHFCQGQSTGNAVSTAAILIQSLIFQTISLHHEQFIVRAIELTQERFQAAQDDVERLWTLFLDVLGLVAKEKCVWIIIDHVDILQRETNLRGLENALALLRNLNALADGSAITVKTVITARTQETARLSTKIAEARILASRHAIITVPRGHHRQESTLLAKSSKRISRLPEQKASLTVPTDLVSVESLLSNTDSDNDSWDESTSKADYTTKEPKTTPTEVDNGDDVLDSDSASLFDPLASSDDSESGAESQKVALHHWSSEDSSEEEFSQEKPFGDFAEIRWESQDDEGHQRKQSPSPVTPKITVAFSRDPPCSRGSRSGSDNGRVEGNAIDTKKSQPALSDPEATTTLGSTALINSGLSSESDSDEASF